MERREDANSIVSAYFNKHTSGTAKEIYNRTGRRLSHSSICNALDKLKTEGKLDMRVAPANKFMRAHYVFFRVNKKEPLLVRFFNMFKSMFN